MSVGGSAPRRCSCSTSESSTSSSSSSSFSFSSSSSSLSSHFSTTTTTTTNTNTSTSSGSSPPDQGQATFDDGLTNLNWLVEHSGSVDRRRSAGGTTTTTTAVRRTTSSSPATSNDSNKIRCLYSGKFVGPPHAHVVKNGGAPRRNQVDSPEENATSGKAHSTNTAQMRRRIDYARQAEKPPYSYAQLIAMAMEARGGGKILLTDIYSWIKDNFCYFRSGDTSWQNSVRHNLSLNKQFVKVPRSADDKGKGSYWIYDKSNKDPYCQRRRNFNEQQHKRNFRPSVDKPQVNPAVKNFLEKTKKEQEARKHPFSGTGEHLEDIGAQECVVTDSDPLFDDFNGKMFKKDVELYDAIYQPNVDQIPALLPDISHLHERLVSESKEQKVCVEYLSSLWDNFNDPSIFQSGPFVESPSLDHHHHHQIVDLCPPVANDDPRLRPQQHNHDDHSHQHLHHSHLLPHVQPSLIDSCCATTLIRIPSPVVADLWPSTTTLTINTNGHSHANNINNNNSININNTASCQVLTNLNFLLSSPNSSSSTSSSSASIGRIFETLNSGGGSSSINNNIVNFLSPNSSFNAGCSGYDGMASTNITIDSNNNTNDSFAAAGAISLQSVAKGMILQNHHHQQQQQRHSHYNNQHPWADDMRSESPDTTIVDDFDYNKIAAV